MAKVNCNSCDELREKSPNLIVNGLGDTECTSLANNTGLNPSSGNDDCDDLHNLNDCLIGNMEQEIDAYDVCDWKDYMRKYVENSWTVFKGIICAVCGLWTNIHELETKTDDFCVLIEQMISPKVPVWGRLPLANTEEMLARRCGWADATKVNAQAGGGDAPASLKPYQNIGLYYAKKTITSCSNGRQEVIEWIAPSTYLYDLKAGASSGDVLWKISKSEAQSVMGMSDYLWDALATSSWTWHETALDTRQMAWLKLTVGTDGLSSNELGIVFMGCAAPNAAISEDTNMAPLGAERCKIYRHYV